jgi:hypothetical protein
VEFAATPQELANLMARNLLYSLVETVHEAVAANAAASMHS